MLNEAIEYSKKGFKIVPLFWVTKSGRCSCQAAKCRRIGKHPITKNGILDATEDVNIARDYWAEKPYNIGLATGHNGLIVIDIDTGGEKNGEETIAQLEAQYGKLPETLSVITGSGGRHLYFYSTQPIVNSQGRVGPSIDVRGKGGYVILPPSNHTSGNKYRWANEGTPIADIPDWLEAKCMTSPVNIEQDGLQKEVEDDAKKQKLTPDKLIRLLEFIPADCDRDTWWKVGAALKVELGNEEGWDAWIDWSKKAPEKFDEKTARVQWRSFEDKGVSGGSIYHFAKENGFRGFDIEQADAPEFRNEWCYVAAIKRFVHMTTFTEWDREQFDAMHSHQFQKGGPTHHVLQNPNFLKLGGVTFWPKQPVIVEENGEKRLNYWRPSKTIQQPAPAVNLFQEHIQYLFPEKEESDILTQYLAYQVQNQGDKIHWALLLQGVPGTGKSYFAMVMAEILGPHNVSLIHNEILHEHFTGWQRNTQLVIVEEMMARARLELMNKLKPMITEPWCQIREMYKPPYRQANRFNFLFFTNHRDSIIIDGADRRYCVLRTEAEPRHNDYYGRLFDWSRNNAGAILGYLQSIDLSRFPSKGHAPMTRGKRDLIEQSMMPLDSFIHEKVRIQEHPFQWDIHNTSMLVEPLAKFNLRVTPKEVGNAFHRLGYLELNRVRVENSRIALWAVRDFEKFRMASVDQIRSQWMAQLAGDFIVDPKSEDVITKAIANNPLVRNAPM